MQAGIYQHYKGGYYQVLGVAAHSETGEKMVVYVSLDTSLPGPRMRVRPLEGPGGWNTPVGAEGLTKKRGLLPDSRRFIYIGEEVFT